MSHNWTTCFQQWKNKKKYILHQGNVLTFLTCSTYHMQIYRLRNSLTTIFKVIQLPESSRRMSVLPENAASSALCLSPELRKNSQWKWPNYWQIGISVTSSRSSVCSLWKLIWITSDEDKTSKVVLLWFLTNTGKIYECILQNYVCIFLVISAFKWMPPHTSWIYSACFN